MTTTDAWMAAWERGEPIQPPRQQVLKPAPKPKPKVDGPKLLTVAEVAPILTVSKQTVYRLIASGDLPARRIGRQFRIDAEDAARLLAGAWVEVEE